MADLVENIPGDYGVEKGNVLLLQEMYSQHLKRAIMPQTA
jgi:hypothetical protein